MNLTFFNPDNFNNDPYGHLTNQISHVSASLFVVYWFSGLWPLLAVFWLVWEGLQLSKSKDLKDFLEDLFFELSGIFIFFNPWWSIVAAVVVALTTLQRIK